MRASGVLQKCLSFSLGKMHALRKRAVLHAVDALLSSWRLTLMDMARAWPGAERVRAPLKALDRMLSNPHLHAERERLYANMARWLLRGPQPIIVVDWSDLKADKSWCLLRAAVPVGGRTLTILDMVFSGKQQGSPAAEKLLLKQPANHRSCALHTDRCDGRQLSQSLVSCRGIARLVLGRPGAQHHLIYAAGDGP